MKKIFYSLSLLFISATYANDAELWKKPFAGAEINGAGVTALWEFKKLSETKDSSANAINIKLQGDSKFAADGVFGGNCLESFPTAENKAMGAICEKKLSLKAPENKLAVEAWIKLKNESFPKSNLAVIADCKGIFYPKEGSNANSGFSLYLEKNPQGKISTVVNLGFGEKSETFRSRPMEIEPGKWTSIAFTYDGEGRCSIFVNAARVAFSSKPGYTAVAEPFYMLSLGERAVSSYSGFPGFIGQVRVSKFIPDYLEVPFKISISPTKGRSVLVRMEDVKIPLDIGNTSSGILKNVNISYSIKSFPLSKQSVKAEIAKGENIEVPVPVDSSLKPGTYDFEVTAAGELNGRKIESTVKFPLTIVPRPMPWAMPVVMWGTGDIQTVKEIGFTHNQQHIAFKNGPDADYDAVIEQFRKKMDEHLAAGLYVNAHLHVNIVLSKEMKEKFTRVNKAGTPSPNVGVCASAPELQDFMEKISSLTANNFGEHPGLNSCLLNSEMRDNSTICFHDWDSKTYSQFSADCQDALAKGIITKYGVAPYKLKGITANKIIPDDNEYLKFLRWWWATGDGWNDMHTLTSNAMKAKPANKNFWTFYDPAVRVPSTWGSGGNADMISQWTYSYPDPIKVGQATDELFAMAEGNPEQQVMKMTQIIWYRSKVAPNLPKEESQKAQWEKDIPDAKFVTISPDHIKEALWSEISRPVKGIMYHGWESLVPVNQKQQWGYRYTNPETKDTLKQILAEVIKPFGPMLLQVPDWQTDVALLESFTSQMLYGRGTWGWGETWECEMHLILQWAGLQPQIIYEESISKKGLDKFKILAMPNCDALPESVYKKIIDFQKRGGIVIADSRLTPAIVPDIDLGPYKRINNAKTDKEALQKMAGELKNTLKNIYQRKFDSDNMDVVLRLREYKGADYLFALNDARTYGDYLGRHGLVMEKGLPSKASISIKSDAMAVYDLLAHKKLSTAKDQDLIKWTAELPPGGGNIWLLLKQPIAKIKIDLPDSIDCGMSGKLQVSMLDEKNNIIDAVLPIKITITDSTGAEAEKSGYYGIKDILDLTLDIASNDSKGNWKVEVEDLASGIRESKKFTVK